MRKVTKTRLLERNEKYQANGIVAAEILANLGLFQTVYVDIETAKKLDINAKLQLPSSHI